jgi:ribosomal protein S18 acetylase RimI-like enzyme
MIVRPASEKDIPGIARVRIDAWRTTYRGILSDSVLDGLSHPKDEERHRQYMAQQGTEYFVAELPREGIVGYLSGGPHRGTDARFGGEVYAIYVLQEHQRRGIGSALIRAWVASMRRKNINSALIWVLEGNKPGVAFYQRIGGKFIREQSIEIGGDSLRELAFGWDDLSLLEGGGADEKR